MNVEKFISNFIRPVANNGRKSAVVFFPFAGAGAFSAYRFSPSIKDICDLFGVQLPGRENRAEENLVHQHEVIYKSIAQAIIDKYSDYQLVFWGHSLGAYIAFETLAYLEKHSKVRPLRLVLSGARAPQNLNKELQLHKLSDEELIARLKSYGGFPEHMDQNLIGMFLPVVRADCFLLDTYFYDSAVKISTPIDVYAGKDDLAVPTRLIENWQQTCSSNCSFQILPGDHFFIYQQSSGFMSAFTSKLKLLLASTPGI